MKKFDSIIDALREIREQVRDIDIHDSIYLAVDYWGETFYVTDSPYELSDKMVKEFHENGCEPSPETLADEWKVYEYMLSLNKEKCPSLYRNSKKPSFKAEVELIRRKIEIIPEYSLSFEFS